MDLYRFVKIGTSENFTELENESIKVSNYLAILFLPLCIPFLILSILYFPGLEYISLLFMLLAISVLVFNLLNMHNLACILIVYLLPTLYTIYHASLMQKDDQPIASLYSIQIGMCMLSFFLYDISNRTKIIVGVIFSIILCISIPFLNIYFDTVYDNTILKNTIVIILYIFTTIIALGAGMFFLLNNNKKIIDKNEFLFKEFENKNLEFEKNETKLNEYITEINNNKEEEQKRTWITDGLAKFSIIFSNADKLDVLGDKIVYNVVKYLGANQAALYMDLNDENPQDAYLEMIACYAHNRKKYINKRIQPGEGLVGQVYLEKEYVYLTKIPDNYIKIESGLGDANPKFLLIMPLMAKDEIEGILEIASFNPIEPHQIEFIHKISESISSVITSVKISQNTKVLLERSQIQTEQLRAQEEEMRQNMEEIMATQEELTRKNADHESQTEMLNLIIDNIPFPVFIKDENGKYTLVNKSEAEIFGVSKDEFIGFDDSKFITDKNEVRRIAESDRKIVEENQPVYFPSQQIKLHNGVIRIFKTSKVPFYNKQTGKNNILGVSVDLTDSSLRETEMIKEISRMKYELDKLK